MYSIYPFKVDVTDLHIACLKELMDRVSVQVSMPRYDEMEYHALFAIGTAVKNELQSKF